jgi:hypothetical protein
VFRDRELAEEGVFGANLELNRFSLRRGRKPNRCWADGQVMKRSGPASGIGNLEPEPELRTWPITRRNLRAALRWWAWSIVVAPFGVGCATIVTEIARGSIPLGRAVVFAIPMAFLAGVFAGALIIVGAFGCLPFFLLAPWLVKRVPWFDHTLFGAMFLCLLLAIPGPVALGAVWGFGGIDFRQTALVWGTAAASIAIPRLTFKSLRVGAISGGS